MEDFEFGSGQADFKPRGGIQKEMSKERILDVHAGFAYFFTCLFVII